MWYFAGWLAGYCIKVATRRRYAAKALSDENLDRVMTAWAG